MEIKLCIFIQHSAAGSCQVRGGLSGSCQLRAAGLAGCQMRHPSWQLRSSARSCDPQLAPFPSWHTTPCQCSAAPQWPRSRAGESQSCPHSSMCSACWRSGESLAPVAAHSCWQACGADKACIALVNACNSTSRLPLPLGRTTALLSGDTLSNHVDLLAWLTLTYDSSVYTITHSLRASACST